MSDFSPELERLMEYYNNPRNDAVGQMQQRLADVKDVMVQNIDRVLERGEHLELLVDKSDHLNQEAFMFKQSSRQLRVAMFWRKVKIYTLIFFIVGLVILFLCMGICGADFKGCK
uniref:V-SNARE coiled-coil homology domain-containing protein n=2 Tax=Pinguiococcus pyrenoidosus TaxID=172671 RepID=A0A7R9YBB5_9STRA|mmetsp:Transcript_16692/g.63459  ORF Transcript_16692/g.63459 Transcript_16692/m.63459 type:complete len:115 (+) Transcript_16692:460-804(+)